MVGLAASGHSLHLECIVAETKLEVLDYTAVAAHTTVLLQFVVEMQTAAAL